MNDFILARYMLSHPNTTLKCGETHCYMILHSDFDWKHSVLRYAEHKKMPAKYGGPIKTISICSTFHAPHILMIARYWNFLLPETSISIFIFFFAYTGPIVCWSVAWSVSLYHCWIVFLFYLHCNDSKLSLPSHSSQWCHVSGLVTGLVVASFDAMC